MKEKEKSKKRPKRRHSWLTRLRKRGTHRIPAHVTREDDQHWRSDTPNIKLSRAFVVVLALHVLAVGGILAFEIFKPNPGARPEHSPRVTAVPSGQQHPGAQPEQADPAVHGLDYYRVRSNDTIGTIAKAHGVTVTDLERLNGLGSGGAIYPGHRLWIPNRKISAETPSDVQQLLDGRSRAIVRTPSTVEVPSSEVASVTPAPVEDTVTLGPDLPPSTPVVAQVEAQQATYPRIPAPARERTDAPRADDLVPGPASSRVASNTRVTETKPVRVERRKNTPTRSAQTYVVSRGDTAYQIARRHGITHTRLLKANGISNPRLLRVGQRLKIPK